MQNRNQTTTVRLHIEDIFEGSMGMEVTQKHEEETTTETAKPKPDIHV